ncbi:MAG TPA: PadR family transcriptional regulator [Solirubrobacteraceae bacterium]|jgi:DNA-binding PadR family transcriptional regulator|nr:PadR family transcriptional regulator [Solirubrobacteraceae bacterium]
MTSPINWALLALIVERPSYAYELAQRFERTYAGVLSLSSTSHVYSALDALGRQSLVEELAGSREARQPKPRYRATEEGVRQFEAWLIEQVCERRRGQRLLVLQLAALKNRPDAVELLDRYERAWREQPPDAPAAGEESSSDCVARLLAAERRLTTEANLSWVRHAREELERRNT